MGELLRAARKWWTGLRLDVVIFDQYEDFGTYSYASGLSERTRGEHVIIDCNGQFTEMVVDIVEHTAEGYRWSAIDVEHWNRRNYLRTVDDG